MKKYRPKHKSNTATMIKFSFVALLVIAGLRMPYLNYLALLLACSFIITSKVDVIVELLMFLLSISPIFKLKPGGHTFFTILLLVAISKLLFQSKFKALKYKQILLILAFSTFMVLFGGVNSIIRLIDLCLAFLLMSLVFSQKEKLNLHRILVFFSLGIILASFLGLFDDYIPGLSPFMNQIKLKLGQGEYINRFCGINVNPNAYTMDISIALAGWFGLVVAKQTNKLDYIIIIILSVFGAMSISKSFLVMYAILLLFVLISLGRQNLSSLIKGVLIIGLLCIVTFFIIDKEYINAYINRLVLDINSSMSLSSVTTGRLDIWKGYLYYVFSDAKVLLFGEGLGADYFMTRATHNYFLEMIYYMGIIGSVLYLLCIKVAFPQRNVSVKRALVNYLPIIILFVRGMAINMIFSEALIFYFIIIAVMLNTDLSIRKLKIVEEIQ
ncbi:MAG TPA: hypothetical protein GX712_02970 [Bacteroidales bacterium]|nr:hypothetical protein [Bacteroidales bacterium]